MYKIEEDRIVFKIDDGGFTHFSLLYEIHIEKVYVEKEHLGEWDDYVLYLVKDDMPDLYYYYQESNRKRPLASYW